MLFLICRVMEGRYCAGWSCMATWNGWWGTELCQRREKADRQQGRVTGTAVLSAACLLIILLL